MRTSSASRASTISSRAVQSTLAILGWFFEQRYQRADEHGCLSMFEDSTKVGPLAIHQDAFRQGDDDALFPLLIACATFQAQSDQRVFRILASMPSSVAAQLRNVDVLLSDAAQCTCPNLLSAKTLREHCDAVKPASHVVDCATRPGLSCPVKTHGEALCRYADFGKLPTSAAFVLKETAGGGLKNLHAQVVTKFRTRRSRAIALEDALTGIHRISSKVANLFLAVVSNPDLSLEPPWFSGVDWTQFVVVDRHVDSYLAEIGVAVGGRYDERREAVRKLAAKVDLRTFDRRVRSYNPQLVASAIYHFKSASNRRHATSDCSSLGWTKCSRCSTDLWTRCPVRHVGAAS